MSFEVKEWEDWPSVVTPIDAAALGDMEQRLAAYAEEVGVPAGGEDGDYLGPDGWAQLPPPTIIEGGSTQVLVSAGESAFGPAVARPPVAVPADAAAGTPSLRTLGAGSTQALNKATADALYAPAGSEAPEAAAAGARAGGILNGLPMVATGLAKVSSGFVAGGASARIQHVVTTAGADLRFWYGGGAPISHLYDPKENPVRFRVGVEVPGLAGDEVIPLTFGGKPYGELGPYGAPVCSDPLPIEVQAGDVLYTRPYVYAPVGPPVALAAAAAINDTTLQLATMPREVGTVQLDLTNPEFVTIYAVTGESAPFTAHLAAPLTKAHNSGRTLGQVLLMTAGLRTDRDEGYAQDEDLSYGGTFDPADLTLGGTPLVASAAAGDSIIQVGTQQSQYVSVGPLIVGNGHSSAETRGLRTLQTSARIFLSEPLENPHSVGQTVSSTILSNRYGLAPTAITADRTTGTRRPAMVGIGDSIMRGAGTLLGEPLGFIDRAATRDEVPFINCGRNGDFASAFVDGITRTYNYGRKQMLTAGDYVVTHWSNDLGVPPANTPEGLLAAIDATWALARARGLKIAACTILPRSQTSDFGMTLENMEPDEAREAIRVPFNDELRSWVTEWVGPERFDRGIMGRIDPTSAGATTYGLSWIIDIAEAIESAHNSGLWRVDGAPLSDHVDITTSVLERMVHPTPGEAGGNALIASYIDLTVLEA